MSKKWEKLVLLLLFSVCSACGYQVKSSDIDNQNIARVYLEDRGYTILSHEQSFEPYILTNKKLRETYYMQIWQMQKVNPEDYLGKEIYGESFIVKNHLLDYWETDEYNSLGKTLVHVLVVDGKVIGGISSPITEEETFGAPWSLDGKTFEELYPNVDWKEWSEEWLKKYNN